MPCETIRASVLGGGKVEVISQKFVNLAHATGLALCLGAIVGAPSAAAAPPQITVSPEPPTGWLSDGEYPMTATVVSDRDLVSFAWGFGTASDMPAWAPCARPGCVILNPLSYVLRPAALPDGVRQLSVAATYWSEPGDQARRLETASRTFEIRIDRSAPAAPTDVELVGGAGWRAQNQFSVRWTPTHDAGTPFVAAHYRVCPADNAVGDNSGCVTGERRGSELSSLSGVSVPGSGVWRVQLAIEDAMGHVDLGAGAIIDDLRLDTDAPQLAFLPSDLGDPARVQLSVSDHHSGVASVAIEARRKGEASWRTLAVSAREGRLTALLDDDNFPAGAYEVRGHAVDAVGNERTLGLRDDELIQLPVRQGTKLSAGASKRTGRKGRSVLDPRPSVRYGARVPIHGRVTDAFGEGRANVSVEVSERLALPGVAWRRLQTLVTDENGAFTYSAPKGVARTLRFEYAGTPTTRAAASEVALQVRAASTLRPSRRNLRNGDTVVLRGRLLGRPRPSTGKIVTVQAWTSRGWLTFGNARARAKDGKWSYRYTFTGTTRTSRYRFRAVIPREETYPYATGTSRVIAVVVRAP
jgi:hypothetical protein